MRTYSEKAKIYMRSYRKRKREENPMEYKRRKSQENKKYYRPRPRPYISWRRRRAMRAGKQPS